MNTNYSLTEGNRENGGYRFLAGSRILCFLRCLLFASYRQSNSSPPSCALVSISGFDFVNLRRKTRLRGIAVRMTGMNADHSQFWCLLTGPAESKPNSRMMRAKTIGVMLMASSIIEKKSQGRENRAELRATDSKRRTRRKRSSRRWLKSSSRYFLKLLKTDISQKFEELLNR